MSRLVVDSSVVIKWLFNEPDSDAANRLIDRALERRTELLALDSIGPEVVNAIWVKFHRGLATAEESQQALAEFRHLPVRTVDSALLLDDAMRLALEHRRSFYDCLFLALSVRENCGFVTADEKLANAVGQSFPNLWLLAIGA